MSLTGFEGLAAVEPADRSPLRRSTYLALSTREFAIAGGDGALDLLEVADLPLAAELPGYERRDDAFRLRPSLSCASFQALQDAIVWKLLRDGAPVAG